MNTKSKSFSTKPMLRKTLIATGLAAALGITSISLGAAEVDRVKRDINIMNKIVKTAFEDNPDCKGCSVSIKGHYLKGQGAVFYVEPRQGFRFISAPESESIIEIVDSVAGVPEIVHEVLADLDTDFEGYSYSFSSDAPVVVNEEQDHASRERIREVQRELRAVERELRQAELELLRDVDAERKELDKQRELLEEQREEVEKKREVLDKERASYVVKVKKAREERKQKRMEAQKEMMTNIENTVLNTFCDYGSTLRSLSRGEHVSVIINSVSRDENSRIHILEQNALEDCDSSKSNFRNKAVSYVY